MTLYFDIRVQNPETASINTFATWHNNYPLLAVSAYSQDKGGFVIVYDDQGEPVQDIESPGHIVAQVTALGWHPERTWLAAGWESGELRVWPGDTGTQEFSVIATPHRESITILQWSQYGGCLVSADTGGSIVGWKIDSRGQLFMTFHHELKESFTQIAFRINPPRPTIDISGLAKAAVAGDERALDLFSSWRPRTAAPTVVSTQRDNHAFYIGTANGIIYFVDSQGQCKEVLSTDGATLYCLLYHQTRDSIIIMTEGLNIGHFQSDTISGELTELTKVKLNSRNDISRTASTTLCWISGNTLAVLTGELAIRCWDLHTGDTYVLSPPDSSNGNIATPQEMCTSLAFCKSNDTLAVGTNLGTIYLWKRKSSSDNDENAWPNVPESCAIHGTVKQLTWGISLSRNSLLAVNCITNVFILRQQSMCAVYNNGICASQLTPTQILLEMDEQSYTLKTDIQVQVIAVTKEYVAVSSGRQIIINRINKSINLNTTVLATFTCDTEKMLIYEHTLIVLTPINIQLRSVEGSVIQTLPSLPEEGEPITMELTGQYLTVASLNGILKIWDLGKHEAKLHTRAMATYEAISDFAEIIEARCNSDCRCVSITVAMANLMPSPILYVWDIESDQVHEFDFGESNDIIDDDSTLVTQCRGRLVTAHCWDMEDPRLLVCRAQRLDSRDSKSYYKSGDQITQAPVVLVSLFATSDHSIVVQDVKPIADENCRLLGVHSPYIVILNSEKSLDRNSKIVQLLMRDFEELGDCDSVTKKAVMDFSYHISVANMEEAFKAIKSIKNEAVWKSLAKMCVKTKQLNMALLCLGHMKQANAARALREAMQNDTLNLEAQAGVLAVELGLYTDAEHLFREAKRLDLLGQLFEARNKFKEAIELASNENKIREKTSYYNYARTLEQQGKIAEAIDMYTKADCRFEIPKMLLMRPRELLAYLNNSEELEIKNWHAQYIESTGDMETALHLYEQAKDTLSMTRLLCYFKREDEACELVTKTGHAASAYHLAAHYESKNNVTQAIHFYTIAKAYTNAIRLCKEHNMLEELWPLAILAPRHSQIDVAKFYEDNNQPDRAVLLYHKANLLHKALDIAFRTRQYSALQLIIMDVNADSDPALIRKCADYFMQNDQIDKAVDLLATGKDYMAALELIQQHNVVLTEELAEKLTIEKRNDDDVEHERLRISTLEKIAEISFDQGNYHLATKKFTQAGNKLRAMKALLKSGDTEKICFFAQVSRNSEIYIMAGNYLQSLDWQNQPEILKNIINFYSKGKAMDLLANFYVACAQVEIDEFQNYEKALDALNQASRCLIKVMTPRDPDVHKRAVELVNNRMSMIKRYLDIKRLFERGETETAMQQVRYLLDSQGPSLEQSVRRGDLFATITQHYANIGDLEKARATIEELKRLVPGINLSYYFNINLLELLGYKMTVERQDGSDKDDGIEELLGE